MGLNYVLRRSGVVWLSIILVVGQGCAARVPPRPTGQIRAMLGTIGVVSANFVPEANAPKAMGKAAGAIAGAAKGLGLGLAAAALCPLGVIGRTGGDALFFVCLGALGTPVLMGQGASEGAKAWIAEEVEQQAKVVLKDALLQRQFQRVLRDHVVEVGQDQGRHPFVAIDESGSHIVDQQVDYRHLVGQGIDTVLEVSLISIGFIKDEGVAEKVEGSEEEEYKNLPFSLTMATRARLIRVRDNKPLSDATYSFRSREHKWSQWVVEEDFLTKEDCGVKKGQAFGEAIGDGQRILAQQIVDEFFSASASPAGTEIRRIERIPYQAFDPNSIKGLGVPEVKVRLATSAEVSEVLGSTPIVQALNKTDFANRLQESIEGRLNEHVGKRGKGNPRLEIVIQRYGFISGPNINPNKTENLCTVINAYVKLQVSDQVVFKERIFWEPYKRSMDVPPPRCDAPSVLGAEQGKLVRRTFEDAAEILAAVIVKRLK